MNPRTLLMLLLFIMFGVNGNGATQPLPTVVVTAPGELADVLAVTDALGALSEKVTKCVEEGGKSDTCLCRYPPEIGRLRKAYQTLVTRHPKWNSKVLSYRRKQDQNGHAVTGTLVMQNVERQLKALRCGS